MIRAMVVVMVTMVMNMEVQWKPNADVDGQGLMGSRANCPARAVEEAHDNRGAKSIVSRRAISGCRPKAQNAEPSSLHPPGPELPCLLGF